MRNLRPLVCALLLTAGCVEDNTGSDESDVTAGWKEGTPESLAVVALVNDRSVTFDTLRSDVGLSKTAATNVIAHRDGKDGVGRTPDDDLYDTITELDAVKQVGPSALDALLDYAEENGYLADQLAKKREVIFSPQPAADSHNARIAQLINSAQTSVDVAMYSFSDGGIGTALADAVKRGVKVRFLFDTASEDKKLTGTALTSSKSGQVEKKGVDVRYVNKIQHHKFMIVDGPRDDASRAKTAWIASGSANWSTSAATKYDENTLFMYGEAKLALELQREFNLLWEHSRDFASGVTFPFELSTLTITPDIVPENPGVSVFLTSANFTVKGDTFTTTGSNAVADVLVKAILDAKKSIHVASGHLRSRPVAEALKAKKAQSPNLDIRVYLDGQEYISKSGNTSQVKDLDACLTAAGTNESKKRDCLDKGFLFGYDVSLTGIDVRYKYYAYRWDAGYAKQMHNKVMIVDGTDLYTGSYNLSDNAEHNTFENMLRFRGPEFRDMVKLYEARFETLWVTGQAEGLLANLENQVKTAETIPLVFEPMSLDWNQVTNLKALIRQNCPDVDSTVYRTDPVGHQTCPRP